MKALGWLLGGVVVGGLVAALKPRETRSAINKMEEFGVDRAVFALASTAAPAGAARQVIRVLQA